MFISGRVDDIINNIKKYFLSRDKAEADKYADSDSDEGIDHDEAKEEHGSDSDGEFRLMTDEEVRRKSEIDKFAVAFHKAWIIRIIRSLLKKLLDGLREKKKRMSDVARRELEEDIECFASIYDTIKHWIPLLEQKLMMFAPYISDSDITEQGTLAKALGNFIRLSRTHVEHKRLWTSLRNKYGTEHASVKASIVGYMQRIAQDEKPSNFEVVSSMQRISFPKQITSFCVSVIFYFFEQTFFYKFVSLLKNIE